MAIYHCAVKVISRGKGKSAVASAAYRSGEKITNEYDGITHDYTRKQGIVFSEIMLPQNAPKEYLDRSALWNSVEESEKASNARLAREIEIALPVELSREQQILLARKFVNETFVNAGMCADLNIHDKGDGNPHAHIMLTTRPLDDKGEWGAKSKKEYVLDKNGERIVLKNGDYKTRKIDLVDWNDKGKVEEWRKAWETAVNEVLPKDKQLDSRSFVRQGIEKIPTIHLGVAATQMERRGIATDKGDENRLIEVLNAEMKTINLELEGMLAALMKNNKAQERAKVKKKTVVKKVPFSEQLKQAVADLPKLANRVLEINTEYNKFHFSAKKAELKNALDIAVSKLKKAVKLLESGGVPVSFGSSLKFNYTNPDRETVEKMVDYAKKVAIPAQQKTERGQAEPEKPKPSLLENLNEVKETIKQLEQSREPKQKSRNNGKEL